MKQFIPTIGMLLLACTLCGQPSTSLQVKNIRQSNDSLFFDIYLNTCSPQALGLASSDIIMEFDPSEFDNPTFAKVAEEEDFLQGGFCTLVPTDRQGNFSDELLQMNYYNNTGTAIQGDELFINLASPAANDANSYNSNLAIVTEDLDTHRLGRFALSGFNGVVGDKVTCPNLKVSGNGFTTKIFHMANATPYNTVRTSICDQQSECITLPLQLLDFRARALQSKVELSWESEDETGFSGFEVQRSTNGIDFTFLAWQEGKGQTTSNFYKYLDRSPPLNQTIYYRLKMENTDGSFEYSKIVTATISKEGQINIFPNPASSSITVQLGNLIDENSTILLTNALGQKLNAELTYVSDKQFQLNTSHLDKGYYFLSIQHSEGTVIGQFAKL